MAKKAIFLSKDVPRILGAVQHAEQSDGVGGTPGQAPIIPFPFERRRFELTESLEKGGTAEAILVTYDTATAQYVTHPEITFTVADALDLFSGDAGLQGYATKWHDRIEWEVDLLQCGQ